MTRSFALIFAVAALLVALPPAAADAVPFGVQPGAFSSSLSGNQAGEHADLKATFTLSQEPAGVPSGYVKDMVLRLPAGISANSSATPRCSMGAVVKELCPAEAAVGIAEVTTVSLPVVEVHKSTVFVYNITPYPNEPAAFAFYASGSPVRLDASLPAQSGYRLTMSATDLSDATPLIATAVTLWGVPADHNGRQCHLNEVTKEEECVKFGAPGRGARLPFLSNPVTCGAMLTSALSLESWQEPDALPAGASSQLPSVTGCEAVKFSPSIAVAPETTEPRAPTGYEVAIRLPSDQSPDGRAAAELRSARVALPGGTVISPSGTRGLQACSDAEFALGSSTGAACPPASQIGSVTARTPLLGESMSGQLFLGTPECAPCTAEDAQAGRMIRVLVQAAGSGVLVKLEGSISVDQSSGRLTLSIKEAPQLPIEELTLKLNGQPTALLANPSACGVPLQASAQLTPYSSKQATEASSAPFELTGCQAPRFAPTFNAGTVANLAASSSPAVLEIARTDQDQTLERFTVQMPPGLLGLLSKVPGCAESAAQAGACGAQSEIGKVTVLAGAGEAPLELSGSIFLTGPYAGAPFGLSIVVPALAGPIDLGRIAFRAGIAIDPATAALTIASGPLPQSLAGVPLQIRALSLSIDRPGFMVNPTDCRPQAITANFQGVEGASAPASQHFQAAGCARLAFQPKMTALADARTTRRDGAYVHLKLVSGAGQASIAKLKLDLPGALASRLSTLQGACLQTTFKTDPARCPSSSILGTGMLATPFLRKLLTGPLYLVSQGARAFPEIDAVLQGEGVTLVLSGTSGFTGGVASETFRSLPDAPISTLDLIFPQGPHSAFAANADLCRRRLEMLTRITGHNGAVLAQTTRIAVSGCPKGLSAKPTRSTRPARR